MNSNEYVKAGYTGSTERFEFVTKIGNFLENFLNNFFPMRVVYLKFT